MEEDAPRKFPSLPRDGPAEDAPADTRVVKRDRDLIFRELGLLEDRRREVEIKLRRIHGVRARWTNERERRMKRDAPDGADGDKRDGEEDAKKPRTDGDGKGDEGKDGDKAKDAVDVDKKEDDKKDDKPAEPEGPQPRRPTRTLLGTDKRQGKKLFGLLQGTLTGARASLKKKSAAQEKQDTLRSKIETKVSEYDNKFSVAQSDKLAAEQDQQDTLMAKLTARKEQLEKALVRLAVEESAVATAGFLATQTSPSVLFLPKVHTPATEDLASRRVAAAKAQHGEFLDKWKRLVSSVEDTGMDKVMPRASDRPWNERPQRSAMNAGPMGTRGLSGGDAVGKRGRGDEGARGRDDDDDEGKQGFGEEDTKEDKDGKDGQDDKDGKDGKADGKDGKADVQDEKAADKDADGDADMAALKQKLLSAKKEVTEASKQKKKKAEKARSRSRSSSRSSSSSSRSS